MLLQRCWCDKGWNQLIMGIHRCHGGCPQRRGPPALSHQTIRIETARILIKILRRTELQRVHKHAHENWPLLSSTLDQCAMAGMESPHGGDKLHITICGVAPSAQLLLSGEKLQSQRNTSSFTWAIPEAVSPR